MVICLLVSIILHREHWTEVSACTMLEEQGAQEEAAQPPLLEEPKQRRAQRLIVGRRHLLHAALVEDVAAVHALELEVFGDVCVHQDAHLHNSVY